MLGGGQKSYGGIKNMKPQEFIEMMRQDNDTRTSKKVLYENVIDCMEIALSQTPDTFDIDGSKNVEDAFDLIATAGRKSEDNCIGPFTAAEMLAEYLGTKFIRANKRHTAAVVSLEDFL